MNKRLIPAVVAIAVLVSTILVSASASLAGSMRNPLSPAQPVRVNVNFNIQMPLASLDEAAIVAAQKQGRALIYRLAKDECQVLLDEIASNCQLTGLNAATNIPQSHGGNPLYINLSGSAQFAISLKNE